MGVLLGTKKLTFHEKKLRLKSGASYWGEIYLIFIVLNYSKYLERLLYIYHLK